MSCRPLFAALVLSLVGAHSVGYAFSIRPGGNPKSWQAVSANGRFEFAMIVANEAEDRPIGATANELQVVSELRLRCPRSGMYRRDTGECLWETREQFGFERFSGGCHTLVSDDGEYVAWLSAVPDARPKPQGTIDRWINGPRYYFHSVAPFGTLEQRRELPAVRLLKHGVNMATFTHADVIREPAKFPRMIPFSLSWVESADLEGPLLTVATNDDQLLVFNLDTGCRQSRGLPEKEITTLVLVVLLGLFGVLAVRWWCRRVQPVDVV